MNVCHTRYKPVVSGREKRHETCTIRGDDAIQQSVFKKPVLLRATNKCFVICTAADADV